MTSILRGRARLASVLLASLAACLTASTSTAAAQCGAPASIGGAGGAVRGIDVNGDFAYVVEHGRLTTFDASDPTNLQALGTVQLSSNFLWDVKVSNGIAACADAFWGVRFVDVSIPSAPRYLSVMDTPYGPESVAIGGGYVYAADGNYSVQVIDISAPDSPSIVASISTQLAGTFFYAQEVVLVGDRLYIGCEAFGKTAFVVVDVSQPSTPQILGQLVFVIGGSVGVGDLTVEGSIAYLTDTALGLHVIDVSQPNTPTEIATRAGYNGALQVVGTHLLAGSASMLDVLDITVPANPTLVTGVALPGPVDDIALNGTTALLGTISAGVVTLDMSNPAAPVILAISGTPDQASDVAIANGLAYVADGDGGLKVMDLVNPMVPSAVSALATPGEATGIVLDGNLAYIADGSAGLRIIDITVPGQPVLGGGVDTPGNAVEVALDGNGHAFIADGAPGLHILDVSNPNLPFLISSIAIPGINPNATAVDVDGNYAYVTDWFNGLAIVDISNLQVPSIVSITDTFSAAKDVVVSYPYAYVVDSSRRIYVIDISVPSAPVVLSTGPINSSGSKIVLVGNRIYLSQGQGGYFETYDISNPTLPVLVGTVSAPTLGAGLAHENGILVVTHGKNGLVTFNTSSLPYVALPVAESACGSGLVTLAVPSAGQFQSGGVLLSYQWRFAGTPLVDGATGNGSTLLGTTSAALRILSPTGADSGTYDCLVSNLCGTVQSAPLVVQVNQGCTTIYCSAKSGLTCGLPAISSSGTSSVTSATGFTISAAPALGGKFGLLIYSSSGRASVPFEGGLLCLLGPKRAIVVPSGGTSGQCDGVFSLDMNAFTSGSAGGNPQAFLQSVGTIVQTQWWGRDTLATGVFLSDALEYTVGP